MHRTWSLIVLLLVSLVLSAQVDTAHTPHSRHGWRLSPHGTIRVLLIFAEVDYDLDPSADPHPEGSKEWPKGALPTWKDDVFDPFPYDPPRAMVTRYYHDASLGHFRVLGDYVEELVVLRQSEHANAIRNGHGNGALVVSELNKRAGVLRTKHGLSVADFDMWKRGGKQGMPKVPGADEPHSYDHVMVVIRNGGLRSGSGSVDAGSVGDLFGYGSDSQSRFGASGGLPFEILRHEFNHLLLGGNNFHSGGGNAATFQSFFIPLQGGWGLMGAANSSLMSCSAWDRYRLGWKPEGARYEIAARDLNGGEVNADLDPTAGDTGVFVLRDFVTSGDALRIRMPFLPDDVYQQWLWVENHQGAARNGSPTDRYHWEGSGPCIVPFQPGLYMQMQVDRENRTGHDIYGGHADFLRPVPANGNYDLRLRGDTLRNTCPFGGRETPFVRDADAANPLTGNHEQEMPVMDLNGDGRLERKESFVPGIRIERGSVTGEMVFFGRPEHAFHMGGNRKLGMGTNPSSANMLTLVSSGTSDLYKGGPPNVRTIHLNGISIELLDVDAAGNATVRVRNNDVLLDRDVRWCADSIVLPPLRGRDGHSLVLEPGRRLLLDRSGTPTRIDRPERANGVTWFSGATRLTVSEGASVLIRDRATLELVNGSELHLMSGSVVRFARKARLKLAADTRIVLHGDARLEGPTKLFKKHRKKGRIR